MNYELDCKVDLVQALSKKTGEPYICLELTFPNGYKKRVFLDGAETYMLQSFVKQQLIMEEITTSVLDYSEHLYAISENQILIAEQLESIANKLTLLEYFYWSIMLFMVCYLLFKFITKGLFGRLQKEEVKHL